MKALVVILSFVFSCVAFAEGEDPGTVFHHQAAGGRIEVVPTWINKTQVFDSANGAGKTKVNGNVYILHGEYGINDTMAAGGELAYVNLGLSTDPASISPNIKGMDDINLFFKGKAPNILGGVLTYGLSANVNTEPVKIDQGVKNISAGSGGINVTPYVGYEQGIGMAHWGLHLSYYGFLGDQKIENSASGTLVNSTRNGGQQTFLTAFYEQALNQSTVLGGAVEYGSFAATKTTTNGTEVNDNNSVSGLGFLAYGLYAINPNILFIPVLKYEQFAKTAGLTDVKSANNQAIILNVDFIF